MNITVNSYFSGAGLFDIGLLEGGLQIGKSFEIDLRCCKVQYQTLGDHVVQADISQKLALNDEGYDAMIFTYPCTKYSAIADIHGTRTGDELFLHALRQPEMYVIENVPGMKKFKVVMKTMTRLPDYYIEVFCPVNASNWLPQNRGRLIVIASRKQFNFRPSKKAKATTLKEILEKDAKGST